MSDNTTAHVLAQEGLRHIEQAILMLLDAHPSGLGNSQIANALGLRSSFRGGQRNYLTYSVLGGLMEQGKVTQDSQTKAFTATTKASP